MAKRVFFSFHYQDVIDFRANVVRQHCVTKPDREAAGFFDTSIWQSATRMGDPSVKRLINGALDGNRTVNASGGGGSAWLVSFSPDSKERLAAAIKALREVNRLKLGEGPGEFLEACPPVNEDNDVALVGPLLESKQELVLHPLRLR